MGSTVDIANLDEYRSSLRHSAAHVLAEATLKLFPNTKLTIGPAIENGFYYDFDSEHTFVPEDLKKLEKEMIRSIKRNTKFEEREVSREEAFDLVGDNPYKRELIAGLDPDEQITIASHSNGEFEDLCRGGHVERTGLIKAVKLLSVAGAYWRGDETRPQLQRIYGTAWESKEKLQEHLDFLKRAEESDHRRLGRELGLFFFDRLSPASPFFLPKGTFLVNYITDHLRKLYKKYGYLEVITPQIFNIDLWKQSGHYDNYAENMFFIDSDGQQYGVKPMNCPAAMLIYGSGHYSYRDLPYRIADFGRIHRYERSGVSHGLTRVRSFCQDDAHIFCTLDQIHQEASTCLDMLAEIYDHFGFDDPEYTLSLRPDKRVGSDEMWDNAEDALRQVLKERKGEFREIENEGAFYGPKIDIFVPDALGRKWQLGTVQLDFSQPSRFNLEYVTPDGSRETPVVIHRALIGSIERFLGVLIESTASKFSLQVSPTQVIIIPITDRHNEYARQVAQAMRKDGIRVEINDQNERLNRKIRDAQLERVPYMAIVGDDEQANRTVALRERSGKVLPAKPLQTVIDNIVDLPHTHRDLREFENIFLAIFEKQSQIETPKVLPETSTPSQNNKTLNGRVNELGDNDPTLYVLRAVSQEGLGHHKEALEDCERAIDLGAGSATLYGTYVQAYIGLGRYQEALSAINRAIDLDNKNVLLYGIRATIHLRLLRFPDVLKDCELGLELDDNNASLYNARATAHTQLKDYEKALSAINHAIKLDDQNAVFFMTRVRVYTELRDYEKALSDSSRAIELDGDNIIMYLNRARVRCSRAMNHQTLGERREEFYEAKNDFVHALSLAEKRGKTELAKEIRQELDYTDVQWLMVRAMNRDEVEKKEAKELMTAALDLATKHKWDRLAKEIRQDLNAPDIPDK